jgi:hypothetical protein
MALIVEDGTGLSTAESYVSVAEADAYFALFPSDNWFGTESEKENALRVASRDLDLLYGAQWLGTPFTTIQALSFPRVTAGVPTLLKRATIELAALQLTGFSPVTAVSGSASVAEESIKVGGFETRVKYFGASDSFPRLTIVRMLLAPLLALTPSPDSLRLIPVVRG